MADDTKERYINPYTDFGFKKLFEQAEIARYSEIERRQYEDSKKVFWDNYSVLRIAMRIYYLYIQFSTFRPGMRPKCSVLPVTTIRSSSKAVAAMNMSISPIFKPLLSSIQRISPYFFR